MRVFPHQTVILCHDLITVSRQEFKIQTDWKQGIEVDDNPKSKPATSRYRLTITDAKHENAAEYKCTVSFTQGTEYKSSAVAYLVINDDITLEVLTPFVLADVTNPQASLSFRGQLPSTLRVLQKSVNLMLACQCSTNRYRTITHLFLF